MSRAYSREAVTLYYKLDLKETSKEKPVGTGVRDMVCSLLALCDVAHGDCGVSRLAFASTTELTLETEQHTSLKSGESDHIRLRHLIEHAAHLLPAQGPIEVFVHHNTLHAFEEKSFHEAVKAGLARYHAEPYLSEQEFRRLYASGRIVDRDLEAVIQNDLGDNGGEEISGLGTRTEIQLAMLRHALQIGPDAELRWIVAETDALERFREQVTQLNRTRIINSARKWLEDSDGNADSTVELNVLMTRLGQNPSKWSINSWETFSLHLLWRICRNGVRSFPQETRQPSFVRPRDRLMQATGADIDRDVHELLVRFCAAYVDQGYSDWLLPNRNQGFFESFVAMYSKKFRGSDRWLRRLPEELDMLSRNQVTAEHSIEASLRELGISEGDREEFLTQSLLALGGWAGIIWQLESGVDWVVHSIPKVRWSECWPCV